MKAKSRCRGRITALTMSRLPLATAILCVAIIRTGWHSATPIQRVCTVRQQALPPGRTIRLPQAWRTRVPEELYPTTYITAHTVQYLERYAAAGTQAPFFLFCSYPDPHHPFAPPGRYFDLYKPEDMPLPSAWGNAHDRTPPHMQALVKELGSPDAVRHSPAAFAVTSEEACEGIALTYGLLRMIDDGIGQILDTLDRLGLARHTVVLFTSDHGDSDGRSPVDAQRPLSLSGAIVSGTILAEGASGDRDIR